jgi:hypothetical protein
LLIPWGVPQTAARLYGYPLLCAEPVSLVVREEAATLTDAIDRRSPAWAKAGLETI